MMKVPIVVLVFLAAAGCATIDPAPKINQATDLAEKKLGTRPLWDLPWDEDAVEWREDQQLSLDEAIEIALRHNRELRADLEMIGAAQADLVQAGLLQNPVINIMAMFPEGGGRSMLRGNGVPIQPLQDLWLRPARQRIASARLEQTVLSVSDRAIQTAASVKELYARLRFAQRAVEIIQENMGVVERSTQLIQTRQVGGKATQVEVNLSRIRRLQLRSELVTMQAEVREMKRKLLAMLGQAAASDAFTVPSVDELKEDVPPLPTEADLIDAAQTQRLDLLAARWSLESAGHEVDLMRKEAWPEMALGLTFERAPAPRAQDPTLRGQLGNAAVRAATNNVAEPEFIPPFSPQPRDLKYTIGPMLEMELPIFDRNQAGIAKAIHEYQKSRAEYDAKRQDVVMNVRRASVTLDRSAEQVRFFRDEILPEVEQNLRLVEQSYRSGQDDLTVYLQVYEDLLMNRLKLLEHLRDWMIARAQLEREVGGSFDFESAVLSGEQTLPDANMGVK